ncbi:MAG: hypothetical protein WB791_09050 [Waddliaceae bacterium]
MRKLTNFFICCGVILTIFGFIYSTRLGVSIGKEDLERELLWERIRIKREITEKLSKQENIRSEIYVPTNVFFTVNGPLPNKDYLLRKLVNLAEGYGVKHTEKADDGTLQVRIDFTIENDVPIIDVALERTVWVYTEIVDCGALRKTTAIIFHGPRYHEEPESTNLEICDNICKLIDIWLSSIPRNRELSKSQRASLIDADIEASVFLD